MKLLSPVLFCISLTTRPIFLGPLCVALLHNWDFLPWLLRQSDINAGLIVSFFWENHAFSYKHGCLFLSTLSLFFYSLVNDEALVPRLVSHLLDNSSHFSSAIVARSAPQLRFSTLVTKTERYWCWIDWVFWEDHAFSYKLGCLIPSTLSLFFKG